MTRNHYRVTGMTCAHCEQSVTTEMLKLPGVQEVKTKLVPNGNSTVMVISDQVLPLEAVSKAVADAGYELVDEARPRGA